ncbi:CHASE2 domain-containing protein [Pseudomonas vancouverensis]|nr:CHASE2 domain-containing protein [Pseudomonas vancouverensis]
MEVMPPSDPSSKKELIKGIEDFWPRAETRARYRNSPRLILGDLHSALCHWWQKQKSFLIDLRHFEFRLFLQRLVDWRTGNRALVIFIAWFFTMFLLDKVDPFGLSRQVQAYSEGLFQKVTSSFYQADAQDKVAVVLIDELTLTSRGESWPPRYSYYDEVIRRIARQKPAAIFLDILVEDRRSYDGSLESARQSLTETLANKGIPLYLATLDNHRKSVFIDVPGTQTTLTGWRGYGEDYPLLIGPGHFFADLDSKMPEGAACNDSVKPTAALQLYQFMCEKGLQSNCPSGLMRKELGGFCNAMVVQWGRQVSKVVSERQLISETQCSANNDSLFERVSTAMNTLFAALLSGLDEGSVKRVRQPCPYTVTLREEDLTSEKAQGVLQGRVVMVGLSLQGIHDIVQSPVHGQIPGVYLHAMALDNLLKWNASYFQRSGLDWLFILMAALVAWICAALIRTQPARLSFLMRVVALGSVLGASTYLYKIEHHPPLDWLGILLVYELVNRLIEKNEEQSSLKHPQGGDCNESDEAARL